MNRLSQHLHGADDMSVLELQSWFDAPSVDVEADARVALRDGELVAYADVGDQGEAHRTYWIDLRHDPRRPDEEAALELLRAVERRARETATAEAVLRIFTSMKSELACGLADREGYQPVRYSFRMEVELTAQPDNPTWPEGVTVRNFRPGEDDRPVYEAHQETFEDAWGFIREPFEEWSHWMFVDGRFDPTLWQVAEAGGEVAGVAICPKHEPGDPELGWVDILGVRRPWRRQGVARALLLQAFGEYYRRGFRRVGLGVDAESPTGAVALYESVGMRPIRRNVSYEKPVANL